MRIVLDGRTTNNHFPGIGRYVYNLVRAMIPQLTSEEKLVLLYDPNEPTRWDLTQLTGPLVETIEITVSPFSFKQQWQVPVLLKKLNATLYHSPYYLMPYKPGVPTLLTVYDMIPLRYPHYVSRQARLFYRLTHRLALRTAVHVVTISQATTADLHHFFNAPGTKVSTIYLAADPAYTPQSSETIAELRTRFALPPQFILYLGSNKPHKNLVRLVQAWAQMETSDIILVIAGVWDERYPGVKQAVRQSNLNQKVKFLGPISERDLPALYSGAMAFVFPSEYEGFGLPVLEAMACGVPVVCSNTSSLPEVAGDAAVYFNPVDTTSIAEGLDKILHMTSNDRWVWAQRSANQAKEFCWEKTVQKTLEVYREIL